MSDVNSRIAADLIASCIDRHLGPEPPANHRDLPPPAPQPQCDVDDRRDDNASAWDRVVDFDDDVEVRIEPGEYEAKAVRAKVQTLFRSQRLVLTFLIINGKRAGTRLRYICTIPPKGRGGSSKFVRAWTIANGKPPKRRDRLPISVFRNRLLSIRVRDVTTDRYQKELATPYSIVDAIIEKIA
jgi:hypothetical protein